MDLKALAKGDAHVEAFLSRIPAPLLESARPMTVPEGRVLVRREEPVDYAYILLSGDLVTFSETEDGKKSNFITLDAPSLVSDLELLARIDHYAANVMASTTCTLLRCDALTVSEWLDRDLPFLRATAELCNRKTFDSSYYQGKSAFRSSLDKVAIYLLRYCALQAPEEREVVVSKTRQTMSSELIMSAKTVDRCLQQLQDQGCLSIVRGKVHITAAQRVLLTQHWGGQD